MENLNAHSKKAEEVVEALDSNIEKGLTENQVQQRLEKYGKNELKKEKGKTAWDLFIGQFKDFLIYLLLFAILISVIIGFYNLSRGKPATEFTDAIVIAIILVVNAILGFYQEYKAEMALESLKKLAPRFAKVRRDGIVKEIDIEQVVPGDIVLVEEGDKFPADLRIYKEFSLYVDEAILTGESEPVKKSTKPVDQKEILADRKNLGYMNTIITRGNGEGVVIGTGMTTEIGKIAESLQAEETEQSPFQREVDQFGRTLGIIIIIICAVVFFLELFLILIGNAWTIPPEAVDELILAFEIAISLAVSAVPEGLVVVITVVMSIGMRKMANRNALVRKLTAVETLGRVNIICSDKTGTLTKNEMTVVKVFLGGKEYDVEGVGYTIEGKILNENDEPLSMDTPYLKRFLEVCQYCNNANVSLKKGSDKETETVGDPTEICLKILSMKMGLETEAEKLDEIPFDSDRKMMSVAVDIDGKKYSLIKGAPDILLENASKAVVDGEVKPIDNFKEEILEKNEEFARNALRVLGFAFKPLDEDYEQENMEQDYIYLGLTGIIDPPRDEVKAAINEARQAGIRTIMITGDHRITAMAIAHDIGLTESEEAITGKDIEEMSDDELLEKVKTVDIYARVTSEHKLRILKKLKQLGKVVAMTGDGVNDAPAVKGANVGIAMGIKGTEVTQEASEMILIDDNYATIINAIEEGRGIYETTKGFFRYMLSTNFDEIFLIIVAYIMLKLFEWGVIGIFFAFPIKPLQILWLNIATDGIPAMVLGLTPTDPDVMKDEPRKGFTLINEIKGPVLLLGIYTSITDITLYLALWIWLIPAWTAAGIDPMLTAANSAYAVSLAQTILFTNLVVCELLFVYACTSNKKPFYKFPNKHLFWATGLSFALQLIMLYTPMGTLFHVVPLFRWEYWVTLIIAAFSVFIVDEIRKYLIRLKDRERLSLLS